MTEFDNRGFIKGAPMHPDRWGKEITGVPSGRIIANHAAPPGILVVQNYVQPSWCDGIISECSSVAGTPIPDASMNGVGEVIKVQDIKTEVSPVCLLYTSDAADE